MAAVDLFAVALRGFGFVAAFQAAGTALFLSTFADDLPRSGHRVRALGRSSALAAVALVAAHQAFEPARLLGGLPGLFDASLHLLLLRSDAGTTAAVRVLGLVLVGFGFLKEGRGRSAVALIGATLVVVSFTFTGHTAGGDRRWLLATLLIVHLLILAFWFGALMPLYLAAGREDLNTNARIIERFSAMAVRIVPLVFVAGAGMTAALLPSFAALRTPYGLLLLGKVAAFALLMLLASLNKWRLGPTISAGRGQALRALRTSVLVEWGLIAAVLFGTAAMTALFSPR